MVDPATPTADQNDLGLGSLGNDLQVSGRLGINPDPLPSMAPLMSVEDAINVQKYDLLCHP